MYYIYDNEDIRFETDSVGAITAEYTHGLGIDEPLSMRRNGTNYYYHVNGLGSVTALTNSSKTVVQSYVYDSFGQIISQTGSITNPYTFTAREYDSETGSYYYRARYYDARTGKFISEDPIGLAGGDINLYSYVGNNSVNFVDPLGLAEMIFNPKTNTLTVVDKNGNVLGQFPAGNVTDRRSKGPIPPGTYPVGEPILNVGKRATTERIESQGPYFIPINDVPGRSEIGIHGGRIGHLYPTKGCIRVGNEDLNRLVDIHRQDPVTQIYIKP